MGMARVARFPVPVHEPTHETGKSYVRPLALAVVNNVVALCDAAAVAARNISLRGCLLSALNRRRAFGKAVVQRPKLSDPAHGTRGLQTTTSCRVRCSAWLCGTWLCTSWASTFLLTTKGGWSRLHFPFVIMRRNFLFKAFGWIFLYLFQPR